MTTSPRFFGGDPWKRVAGKVNLFKVVEPLKARTFKEFCDSHIYLPVRLPIPEAQYRALETKDDRNKYKFVQYFTPCTFREEGGEYPKRNEFAVVCNLICLDIDPIIDRESGEEIDHPAKPFIDAPESLFTLLDNLNFAAYRTISHTPQSPRIRVVVEAAGLPPEVYPKAVEHVAARLGLPHITVESKKISQAMFRPTVFKDTDLQTSNPVFAYSFDGKALTEADLGKGGQAAPATQPRGRREVGFLDGLEFLKPISEGVTLEDVGDALAKITPNVPMNEWITIAMAMRHQFVKEDERAFEYFDKWSSEGNTYEGTEKTRYRWDHTQPNTFNRLPVTIRTLFKIAKDHGWENPTIEQKYYNQLVAWLKSCESSGQLIEKGLEKIITTPLVSPLVEGPLLKVIRDEAKKRFSLPLDLPPLKARLKRLRSTIAEKSRKQREKEAGTPAWASGLIYLKGPKCFYRFTTTETIDRDSMDSAYGVKLLPSEKEINDLGETPTRQRKATPIIRPQDYLLNELKIPRAHDFMYDPSSPDSHIITKQGIMYVNTYNKTFPEPNKEQYLSQKEVFLKHISLLIAEEEHRRGFLDFISYMVQNPGEKIRYAFVIQSAKGNGKGLISKALRGVLGHGHVTNVDPETIFSQYNDWAYGSQLVIMNEIRVTGHSRHDVMNKLKEPIADDWVSINQKYRDHRQVENVTNYVMFTNAHDALAVDADERRYYIVKSPLQTPAHIRELNESGALKGMMDLVDGKDFSGLRYYFENREISADFDPNGPPPVTKYLLEMHHHSGSEIDRLFDEILMEGNPYVQEDLISSTALLRVINREMESGTTNQKGLANFLLSRNYVQVGRFRVGDTRHTLWIERDGLFEGLEIGDILNSRIANTPDHEDFF